MTKTLLRGLSAFVLALAVAVAGGAPQARFSGVAYAAQDGDGQEAVADEVFSEEEAGAEDAAATTVADADAGAAVGARASAGTGAAAADVTVDAQDIRAIAASITADGPSLTKEQKAQLLNRIGVMKGDPELGLMLDIKVRRSDAAVFFARLLGKEQEVIDGASTSYTTTNFPDAPAGKWYTPYIAYCVSIGLIAGRTDGLYYPDDNISEKEFANVLFKILGYVYDEDYTWDTVYEFGYDIGLFEDSSYASRTEDNREYYRRDVSNEVFTVLGLEKKEDSSKLLEELVANGAIDAALAASIGQEISELAAAAATAAGGSDSGADTIRDLDEYADIEDIYHLESDLIWVVFTLPVTVKAENIKISQTYDFSKALVATIEESSPYDLVIRTSAQEPDMDYTIDIGNVIEADGTNAGMLSFDFVGYNPSAAAGDKAGLTTEKRDPGALAASREEQASGSGSASGAASNASDAAGTGTSGTQGASGASGTGSGATGTAGSGTTGTVGSGATGTAGAGTSSAPGAGQPAASGNADISTEYFRVVNAYTASSNQVIVYFSQPITEAALNASLYSIYQGGANVASGASRGLKAEAMDNANNAVRLTSAGFAYQKGMEYAVTVSGSLVSGYMARINDGYDDSYVFTAQTVDVVAEDGFSVKSIGTPSQLAVDVAFSQAVSQDIARQPYAYYIVDQAGKRVDVTGVSVISGTGAAVGTSGAAGVGVRLSVSQALAAQNSYTLTVVYMQNAAKDAEIKNSQYAFRYGAASASGAAGASAITITSAAAFDPAVVEVFFSERPDPASAVSASNYAVSWPASTGVPSGTAAPIKATYDSTLSPYSVRLYLPQSAKLRKSVAYTLRVGMAFRDSSMTPVSKGLDMQFYCDSDASPNPAIFDAAVVGENIVRLKFSKEIRLDQQSLAESNYQLDDLDGGIAGIVPTMVKYVDSTTVVLKFESQGGQELAAAIAGGKRYSVRANVVADVAGAYTTRYPDGGSTAALRAGKR